MDPASRRCVVRRCAGHQPVDDLDRRVLGELAAAVGVQVRELLSLSPGQQLPEVPDGVLAHDGAWKKAKSAYGPGRGTRKRRSRKRLAFSHDVSEAKEQQWQAAP